MVGYSGSDRIYGLTDHQLVVPISGGPGRVDVKFLTSIFMVDVRFELTTGSSSPSDDVIYQGICPLGYW